MRDVLFCQREGIGNGLARREEVRVLVPRKFPCFRRRDIIASSTLHPHSSTAVVPAAYLRLSGTSPAVVGGSFISCSIRNQVKLTLLTLGRSQERPRHNDRQFALYWAEKLPHRLLIAKYSSLRKPNRETDAVHCCAVALAPCSRNLLASLPTFPIPRVRRYHDDFESCQPDKLCKDFGASLIAKSGHAISFPWYLSTEHSCDAQLATMGGCALLGAILCLFLLGTSVQAFNLEGNLPSVSISDIPPCRVSYASYMT